MADNTDLEAMELEAEALDMQGDAIMAEGDALSREMNQSFSTASSSDDTTPKPTCSKEDMEKVEKLAMKAAGGVLCAAGTAVALAGAGVVSAFKKDSKPLGDTWNWCKKNLFGTLRDM